MSIALDTSDPLFGNIRAAFAVDPATNQLKELKNDLALTIHADVRFPNSSVSPTTTAPFGPSFRVLGGTSGNLDGTTANDGNQVRDVSFAPITISLAQPLSILFIWNGIAGLAAGSAATDASLMIGVGLLPGPNATATDSGFLGNYSGQAFDAGPGSLLVTRDPDGTTFIYKNGVASAPFSAGGGYSFDFSQLQRPGYGWVAADRFFQGLFDSVLTQADATRLHNSAVAGDFDLLIASGGGDTTAPTLTSPVGTQTGTTTATVGATTNEANGTMYQVVTTSATAPSVTQIQAGQSNTGAAAAWAGNATVTSVGAKTFSATGLTASTAYFGHTQHKDAAGNNSAVVTSASFTTAAASGGGATITPPPLHDAGSGQLLANRTGLILNSLKVSTGVAATPKTGQTTNGSGVATFQDASQIAGQAYCLAFIDPVTGESGITNGIVAV